MTDLIETPVVQALAWALIHFAWQGAAIAMLAFIAFRVVRMSASLRYAIGVGALVAMLVAPVATFFILMETPRPAATIEETAPAGDASGRERVAGAVADRPATSAAAPFMPVIRLSPDALAVAVAAWLTGVFFFSLRLFGGWMVARRMVRRSVRPAADHIQVLALRVADKLALRRVVAVLESSAVAVPVMVGWLKPTIVLPIAALAGLTPTQVEALIAHELAHVRRHDYLVNLLQSVAEVILFYHPAVWWLSRRVRAERELCCDDLAVGVCDPLVYATALTDLASMTSPHVALAATDGDLLGRVRRILGRSETHVTTRGSIMSGLAFSLVATVAVPVALISAAQAPRPAPQPAQVAAPATTHISADRIHFEGVRLEGRASVHMQPGHPTSLTFDRMSVEQTTQQTDQRRREELERRIEEMKKQVAELEMKRAEAEHASTRDVHRKMSDAAAIDIEKAALAHRLLASQAAEVEAHAQAATEAELLAARRQYEAARTLFEKGLTSRSHLLEAEAALAQLQTRGNAHAAAAIELQQAKEKLARSRQLVEKGLMTQADLAALEVQVANLEQRLLVKESAQADRARDLRSAAAANLTDSHRLHELLADRRTAATEIREQERAAMSDRLSRLTADVDAQALAAGETTRVGDTLRITIEGEPDLPSSYRVRDDGTIRLPFVGVLKVSGLTAAQVRDAVGKQLSDRKLGSAGQVQVTLARPRVRESR